MLYRGKDGQDVIPMTGRDPHRKAPALSEIETYWQALSAEHGLVPPRNAVDPRGMDRALAHAFLIHHIAPGIGRLRVAGAHLNEVSGMEVAGMPLSALFTPDARDGSSHGLKAVFDNPAILRLRLRSIAGWSRGPMSAEMVILPLTCEAGHVDRALGGLVTEGAIGRTPRRFGITDLQIEILRKRPERPAQPTRPKHFAEEPAPFTPRPPKRAPHLRVVVSND